MSSDENSLYERRRRRRRAWVENDSDGSGPQTRTRSSGKRFQPIPIWDQALKPPLPADIGQVIESLLSRVDEINKEDSGQR